MATYTICPPAAARGSIFAKQHDSYFRRAYAVHLPDMDEDGEFNRGLSFDDYSRMSVRNHLGGLGERRLPTPNWALSDSDTRKVVLAFMENRCFSKKKRAAITGTERERFVAVMAALKEQAKNLVVVLDRLCAEYVNCADPKRRKQLTIEISGRDRQLQLVNRPDVFYDLVVSYYRTRLNSVECAERLGLSPWGARQLLMRMNIVARELDQSYVKTDPEEERRHRQRAADRELVRKYYRERYRIQTAEKRATREAARAARRNQKLLEEAAKRAERLERRIRAAAERLPTRERWAKEGRCRACGGTRDRQDRTCCARCREKQRSYRMVA